MVRDYLCDAYTPDAELVRPFVSLGMSSIARTCVIPIQDYLGYDNRSRINTPSTLGGNWRWRVTWSALNDDLQQEILSLTARYGRRNRCRHGR